MKNNDGMWSVVVNFNCILFHTFQMLWHKAVASSRWNCKCLQNCIIYELMENDMQKM